MNVAAKLSIDLIPCLEDNYAFLLWNKEGFAAVVDPSDAAMVQASLDERKLKLAWILNTHHHQDHCAGNLELKQRHGARIWAPADPRIPGVDEALAGERTFQLGPYRFHYWPTPGHTRSHGVFYMPDEHWLFTGDTLFGYGCGRIFEGNAQELMDSLKRIASLPDPTQIYCGHEYTLRNLEFAGNLEAGDAEWAELELRYHDSLENRGSTLPLTLGQQKKRNPFLRFGDAHLKTVLGLKAQSTEIELFAELRKRRDNFKTATHGSLLGRSLASSSES